MAWVPYPTYPSHYGHCPLSLLFPLGSAFFKASPQPHRTCMPVSGTQHHLSALLFCLEMVMWSLLFNCHQPAVLPVAHTSGSPPDVLSILALGSRAHSVLSRHRLWGILRVWMSDSSNQHLAPLCLRPLHGSSLLGQDPLKNLEVQALKLISLKVTFYFFHILLPPHPTTFSAVAFQLQPTLLPYSPTAFICSLYSAWTLCSATSMLPGTSSFLLNLNSFFRKLANFPTQVNLVADFLYLCTQTVDTVLKNKNQNQNLVAWADYKVRCPSTHDLLYLLCCCFFFFFFFSWLHL